MAAKSTKLTYDEYKALEMYLDTNIAHEVIEKTVDGSAYRKMFILILAGRELRFVGPWKHKDQPNIDMSAMSVGVRAR